MLGTLLDERYEIIERIGEGSFGETYMAIDQKRPSRPRCVVKRLKPNYTNPKVLDFFNQEAAVLERLGEHPQIPRLLTHFMLNQELYIVQDFVEGHNLRKEIYRGKQLSESYVVKLLQDLLEILAFVHQQNVIHRDIKPENVMRRPDGKLMLIDFGAVKELGTTIATPEGGVASSVVIGTMGYMPSEQARGRPQLSSDVYAVGMIAIEALTGVAPDALPEDPQTGEVLWQAPVNERLSAVLNKMVRDRHSQRYPSAVAALEDLTRSLSLPSLPVASPTESIPPSPHLNAAAVSSGATAEKLPRLALPRRGFLVWAGLAGGGLIAALAASQLGKQKAPPLQNFNFEVVTVDDKGEERDRRVSQVPFFSENLGNGTRLEMMSIPGGTFQMGSSNSESERGSDEGPQHSVTIAPFFMGKYPVTQAQWRAVAALPKVNRDLNADPSSLKGDDRPVEKVEWSDVVEFCDRLSQQSGRTYRLPSEAEWEYACRAGTTTPFHFGPTITTELANYRGTDWKVDDTVYPGSYGQGPKGVDRDETTPVGSFGVANTFGLYDMHGNVLEWCADRWHEDYQGAPTDGSAWTVDGSPEKRVLRGGSWILTPESCRSAARYWAATSDQAIDFGFRVVAVTS